MYYMFPVSPSLQRKTSITLTYSRSMVLGETRQSKQGIPKNSWTNHKPGTGMKIQNIQGRQEL